MDPRTKRTIIVLAVIAAIAAVLLILALDAMQDAIDRAREREGTPSGPAGAVPDGAPPPPAKPRSAVRIEGPGPADVDAPALPGTRR